MDGTHGAAPGRALALLSQSWQGQITIGASGNKLREKTGAPGGRLSVSKLGSQARIGRPRSGPVFEGCHLSLEPTHLTEC